VKRRALATTLLLLGLPAAADQWLTKPVDDRTFKTYLDFFAYNRQVPFDLRVLDTEDQQGVRREHVSFLSTPGVRVLANLYATAGQGPQKAAALILLHGGGALGKDAPTTKVLAPLFARAGWSVLTPDLQYFGERPSDLLTTFSEQEKHDRLYNQPPVYLAWITQSAKDVSRSLDLLVEQRGVDPKRIGVVGMSRGAIVASIVAGADRRLAAVALLYGGHFDALERDHLPAACPANYVGRISPRPLLMINGIHDADMIKDRAVAPLFNVARQPKRILWAETGHQAPTEEHQAALLQWLRENLK